MEPSAPQDQTPPTNPEPATNPIPPTEPVAPAEQPAAPASPEETSAHTNSKLPSAFSLFKPSWEAVKLNLVTIIVLSLIGVAIYSIVAAIVLSTGVTEKNATANIGSGMMAAFALAAIVSLIFTAIVGPAMVYVQLKSANGTKVNATEALKKGLNTAFRFLGLSIIMAIVIGVGFLLLIVPGLFMLRRYILAPYFLIDKDLGITESLNQSAQASKKYSSALWGLIGVTILISLPGIIPFIGGIVSAILGIAYYCAPAVRYKEITTGVPSVVTQ